MAGEPVYTLGRWVVKAGEEAAFIEAWKELGAFFLSLPEPPGQGSLVQSATEPQLFYSFGPWPSAEAVAAMRADPRAAGEIGKLAALCDEAAPGTFRLVASVGV